MDMLERIIHREAELQRRFLKWDERVRSWFHRFKRTKFWRFLAAVVFAVTFGGFDCNEIERMRKAGVIK